jgi:transposase InsO family protein
MDGKSAWRDNVFVERLWRTVKYEEVYLRAYEWAMDITYIPMARGFVYLAVVLDWFSRRVLWSLHGGYRVGPTCASSSS